VLPTQSVEGVDDGVERKPTANRTTSSKIDEKRMIRKMFTFFKFNN
jgi:hypothetical protein